MVSSWIETDEGGQTPRRKKAAEAFQLGGATSDGRTIDSRDGDSSQVSTRDFLMSDYVAECRTSGAPII